jgi:serine/threonine protein kinase
LSQDSLKRGTRLGHYEIRKMLGQGGMGQVYRAWDMVLQRDVAVKTLGVPDPELLRRFAREAEAISQLNHSNVVTIHDFHADQSQPYIVMEHLRGEDLSERLRRGRMQVGEAVDVILGVCSGVQACHSLGIIHRDLKPGNVFLHETVEFGTVVKVLDFGVAMLRQAVSAELTQPGHVVGTPRGIGLLAYTVLAGRSPFAKKEGHELIRAIMTADYPRLREIRPDIPGGLEDAISKAMNVERERRYSSVLAFEQDIAKQATSGMRAPSELFSPASVNDLSTDLRADDSRTTVDMPGIVATRQDAGSMDRRERAAAGMETLEGDDSRPSLGSAVVPIAPFQVMPVVSTTARMPTATAIDLSFGGGKYGPVRVEKTVDLHTWSGEEARSRAPETSLRMNGADDSRTSKILGLGRKKLLLVAAALVLVVLVAILVALFSLRASRSQASTLSRRRLVLDSATMGPTSPHERPHLGRSNHGLVHDAHIARTDGPAQENHAARPQRQRTPVGRDLVACLGEQDA